MRRGRGRAARLADMTNDLSGTGIWSSQLRYGDAGEAAAAAAELESLGYSALWVPDVGGDLFGALENLLGATQTATIATGILNLWMHTPAESAAAVVEPLTYVVASVLGRHTPRNDGDDEPNVVDA